MALTHGYTASAEPEALRWQTAVAAIRSGLQNRSKNEYGEQSYSVLQPMSQKKKPSSRAFFERCPDAFKRTSQAAAGAGSAHEKIHQA